LVNTAQHYSYVSQFVTLVPGDLIFTGTPGQTKAMSPGDVIEIEVEGVGVIRHKIGHAAGANAR
jgi:2-keto-4-pentenoate hydratase/2-oxohepta-3-ene-1,7-dioic acid hydratase in catechol pathway